MSTATRVYVGRQPIYDRRRRVQGYELLFRPHATATESGSSGEEATAAVIVNTFAEFGLDELVGGRKAFINVPRGFVDGSYELPFGPEGVVLELLETIPDTPEIREGVRRLHERGYELALDDYTGEGGQVAFLELASYVKLDAQALSPEAFRALAEHCLQRPITLVAERVETAEDVAFAQGMGAELFQGWYFSKAETLSSDAIKVSGVTALRLLTLLSDPEVTLADVEQTVRVDLALTYRLLRVVNSVAAGLARRVSSIREAIALLGLEQLRNWIMLFMLSDICGGAEGLLNQAVTRARTCELMAREQGLATDEAFTVGLLSNLGELLDRPLDAILADLPLQPEMRAAIVEHTGPLGRVLHDVQSYERLAASADDSELVTDDPAVDWVARSYLESLGWSLRVCRDLVDPVDQVESLTAAAVQSRGAGTAVSRGA